MGMPPKKQSDEDNVSLTVVRELLEQQKTFYRVDEPTRISLQRLVKQATGWFDKRSARLKNKPTIHAEWGGWAKTSTGPDIWTSSLHKGWPHFTEIERAHRSGKPVSMGIQILLCWSECKFSPHLTDVDSVVDRPCRLEALQHALLHGLGQPMDPDEVLQVLGAGVVEWAAWVHPLDDRRHVTKHHSMHQCWTQRKGCVFSVWYKLILFSYLIGFLSRMALWKIP